MPPVTSAGPLLRQWRHHRRLSQLALSLEAGISARHLSFLESGRARPSRDMVLRLAATLDVPLRERNDILLAAGFAPAYAETPLTATALAPAHRALELILEHQEPHPAVVLNRAWDLVTANRGAVRFFGAFIDLSTVAQPVNVIRLMFDPAGLRPWIANWETVAGVLLHRMRREAVGGALGAAAQAVLDEALQHAGASFALRHAGEPVEPLVPIHFRKGDLACNYFSTVTTLGTPQDVTLQELRIECFFPADAATEAVARRGGSTERLPPGGHGL